jgi:hypothetical protein
MTYRNSAIAAAVACAAFAVFMLVGLAAVEISHNGFPTHFE